MPLAAMPPSMNSIQSMSPAGSGISSSKNCVSSRHGPGYSPLGLSPKLRFEVQVTQLVQIVQL